MIILFHGSDGYRLKDAVKNLVTEKKLATPNLTVATYDLSQPEGLAQLGNILKYRSLFDQKILVIANNPFELTSLTEVPNEVTLCLAQIYTKPTAPQLKWLKQFEKLADRHQEFQPLSKPQLLIWIKQFCLDRGRQIPDKVAGQLIERVGQESWALANELEKLCAYTETLIDSQAITILTPLSPDYSEWALTNALAEHNKRQALAQIWQRALTGTPGQLLIGLVASALRNTLLIRDLAGRPMSSAAIAKESGLHPFVVSKNLAGAKLYNLENLKSTYLKLADLDQLSKTGQVDVVDGLFSIVLDL